MVRSDVDSFLLGEVEEPGRHAGRYVGGYVLLVLVCYGLLFLTMEYYQIELIPTVVYQQFLAATMFYSPPFVAAVSALRGGGLLVTIAVGLVPAFTFGALVWVGETTSWVAGGTPDWELVASVALYGVILALAGFAVVTVNRVLSVFTQDESAE